MCLICQLFTLRSSLGAQLPSAASDEAGVDYVVLFQLPRAGN